MESPPRAQGSPIGHRFGLATLLAALVVGAAPHATAQVRSGSYTGNGGASQAVTGLGFRPEVVIVKGNVAQLPYIRLSTMAPGLSKDMINNAAPVAGRIQSLDGDGFTVGNDAAVNAAATTYHWIAFNAVAGEVQVGTYLGDGADNRTISGVGFQPSYMILVSDGATEILQRSSAMGADTTISFDGPPLANRIQQLLLDGFEVGSDPEANANATGYHYVAWKAVAGRVAVGSYTGNDTVGRTFTTGFQPEYVIVRRATNVAGSSGVHKPASTGNATDTALMVTAATNLSNTIQRLLTSGFSVGNDTRVNASAGGFTYYWAAFGSGACCSLAVSEAPGSTTTVTGAGQFELRWNVATGAGIDELYDLFEDPGRLQDHAGGAGNERSLYSFYIEPTPGGTWYAPEDSASGSQLHVIEATPVRVRVRQDAFFQEDGGTQVLGGFKGIGDYSLYGSGRVALRWTETSNVAFTYFERDIGTSVHFTAGAPLNNYVPCYQGNAACSTFPGPGNEDFLFGRRDASLARTDFLTVMHRDWAQGTGVQYNNNSAAGQEWYTQWWVERSGTPAVPASQSWDLLTVFKPTNLGVAAVPSNDPAVTARSTDYRAPDSLAPIAPGSGWNENSADADFFNESEGAYTLDMAPASGLSFDMNGSVTTRHAPFFKIRQWRSWSEAPSVTLEGASLARNLDYRAALKPVARAYFSGESWYSTLQSAAATSTPAIGTTVSVSGGIAFVAGRYGNGAEINANGDTISFLAGGNFDPFFGAVELWYKPSYDCRAAPASCDGVRHVLWHMQQVASDYFVLEKTAANALVFSTRNGSTGTTTTKTVALGAFGWGASDWVHIRATWDQTAPVAADRLRIFVNGALPAQSIAGGPFSATGLTVGPSYVGTDSTGSSHASGVIDEFRVFTAESLPNPLARGGLVASSEEQLADAAKDADLVEWPVDGQGRGEYLYFGSDTKIRGLNVSLATVGAGVAADAIDWRYWNGTAWADLEAGCPGACSFGFTDQTNSFTGNGTVYWTSDPTGWAPYSVNGGPDLYYLRAHLKASSPQYAARPRESRIATDVLLFQYCGDILAAAQTFAFGPPLPATAVKLESLAASGRDRAVLLAWRTGSELDNLGFHVYRSLSAGGPWTRLTPTLVPGLGSSAVGRAYSLLDSGLANGTRYFYRLEDVDASSKATSHGPVSAVPVAGPARDDAGDGRSAEGAAAAATGCPDWVLAAYAPSVGSESALAVRCSRHGDPEAVSLETLSRDARQVTLELRTFGFYALHEPSGAVRVFVRGFDFPEGGERALPVRRALVEAAVGRKVRLGGVRALDTAAFPGLVPAPLGEPEMQVRLDGTVRAARREPTRRERRDDAELVRLLPSLFQGEAKSAALELAPLRYDASRGQLLLARRVRVKLLFAGRESGESGRGSFGRRRRRETPSGTGEVLARLHTLSRGLYAVSFEQLFPGARRGLPVSELRLERQGRLVGFHTEPATPRFGPGGRLYFFAESEAASTDYSGEVAYELLRAGGGAAMPVVSAAPAAGSLLEPSRVAHTFETNRFYQPGLLDAVDPWLWEAVPAGATRTLGFTLGAVSPDGAAGLELFLQGASESGEGVDHQLTVAINGTLLGEVAFAGRKPHRASFELPASILREGANELALTSAADTGVTSLVFLDRFSVAHPQPPRLGDGRLSAVWPANGTVSISGATGPIVIVDVTCSADPRPSGAAGCPTGDATAAAPGGTRPAAALPWWLADHQLVAGELRFRAEAGRRYEVWLASALLTPRVAAPRPSALRSAGNRADYLLIAPAAFLAAAEPLLARREAQGLRARAVAFEDVAAEFGRGQPSAEAIRSFLAHAFHSWRRPSPRYVVLLGDASYDPRRYMASSQPSPLPALFARTSYLWTASDPLLAAVNGDDALPDLAIGRLPAATLEQAETLVQKLLAWEASGQGLDGPAALVADNPDLAGDFDADVDDIHQSFLAARDTHVIKLSQLGAATRPEVQQALDSGLALLGYVGHGGAAVWASENVWNSWDAASLQAQSRQPLLVTVNCLNGYFVAPAFESLSESLLKADGRGAFAAFAPSGLSLDGPAHQYHRALVAALTSDRHRRLGDAVLAAQRTYAVTGLMPELISIYHLLGDPATPIR